MDSIVHRWLKKEMIYGHESGARDIYIIVCYVNYPEYVYIYIYDGEPGYLLL